MLISGDAQQVADAVAHELQIDEVFAQVQPADKDAAVAALQARGRRVAMVGNGVNDAPALTRADVGIAIGAGTDVAIESAAVVIDLSRASYGKMSQNLVWATGYNVLSLPVVAGAFAFAGVTIPLALAAVAMSCRPSSSPPTPNSSAASPSDPVRSVPQAPDLATAGTHPRSGGRLYRRPAATDG